jgi:prephenate dehydrogenase
MLIQRLTIIGVGLIGGSLARALRQAGQCNEIVGCSRHVAHLQQAVELGVIDRFSTHISDAVIGADMVIVAVPLGATASVFTAIRDNLAPHAIITDVGSVKGSVVTVAQQCLGQHLPRFVPAHPIAGTEKSGVTASFASLFEKHQVILTPLPETDAQAIEKVTAMWTYTGANVIRMSVAHHDEVLAATSHLPHILAYSLVDTLATMENRIEVFRFAAGGFRDFTRIASSDPQMWHDICLTNQAAVLEALAHFTEDLEKLTAAIRQQDSQTIKAIFTRAKVARDKFSQDI